MAAKDLVFEIGSEELPAGFIHPALISIEGLLRKTLSTRCLGFKSLRTLATPRRLAVIVEGLDEKQPDTTVETRGPNKKAAFDASGAATQALLGFARAQGVKPQALELKSTDKGEYFYALKKAKGGRTEKILSEILPSILSELSFPKAMRWGNHDIIYARPIHWILAVYGSKTIKFKYGHIQSGNTTEGHRFIKAKEKIKISTAKDYSEKLKKHSVVVDPAERKRIIAGDIEKEARSSGGKAVKDDVLLDEVANLVEYPLVVRGGFDKEFLKLPREVVVNAMREHQRYFSMEDKNGLLLNGFLTVANTPVKNTAVVRLGNEKVLKARLSDARFYFEKDLKTPLSERVNALKGVVFQARLGTSYEKVERFTNLAIYIGYMAGYCAPMGGIAGLNRVEDSLRDDFNPAKLEREKIAPKFYNTLILGRAAMLSKADLTSGMVAEFPNLQGVMGREYARLSGELKEVSQAIYEHYQPTSAGGELPSSDAGAIISIADKLDTITGCFGVGLIPTGAADPYGLRRAALGVIYIILDKGYTLKLDELIDFELTNLGGKLTRPRPDVKRDVLDFFRERLKNQLLSQNLSYDTVDAVLSSGWEDIVDCVKRTVALEKFKKHPACPELVTAFKRVSNILKGMEPAQPAPDETLFRDENEKALYDAGKSIAPAIEGFRAAGEYENAFKELASIKDVIDRFFDKVMVMVDDEKLRTNRLRLLNYVRSLYLPVADLSKLVV